MHRKTMSARLPDQKKLVLISEAAKFLAVSIDTIRRWDKSGVLHSERPDGKNRYFSLEELERYKLSQPLSISEVAKKLGISATTLRRLETRGLFKPSRNSAGERVYNRDSVENFLDSDYFLRKKQISKEISEPKTEEKDFPEEGFDSKKSQDIETNLPEANSNTPFKPFEEIISNSKSSHRIFEALAAVVIFILLSAIGVTNITLSRALSSQSIQTPAVLSETVVHEEPAEASISAEPEKAEIEETVTEPTAKPTDEPLTPESIQSLIEGVADFDSNEVTAAAEKESGGPDLNDLKIILTIKTGGAQFINIRDKPSTESGVIDKAGDGDTFEMASREPDWYEIKLSEDLSGYVSEKFAQIKEVN